ncbi:MULTISPECIES: hypothetical protein [unclassified Nonomuraea]|uniref:hypothetical protein n=1 Tax=unclassified Nonomuraea TaxID=2593643 RepID=UPI0033F84308
MMAVDPLSRSGSAKSGLLAGIFTGKLLPHTAHRPGAVPLSYMSGAVEESGLVMSLSFLFGRSEK